MSNITFGEMSGLNDSVFGKCAEPVKMFLEKRAEAFEQDTVYDKIFAVVPSESWAEKFASLTGTDGFYPTEEGGSEHRDGLQEGYSKTIEHIEWTDRFEITRKIMDDAKTMDLRRKPEAFIAGYFRTREMYAAALYARAAGGSVAAFRGHDLDVKSADGKGVFATDHPARVKGAAQSNKFADALSADAIAAVETAMQNFKGDVGETLSVIPNTIMIPNDYAAKKTVFAALGADKDPATSNNGFNFLFGRYNIIVNPYLNLYLGANSGVWFMLDSAYNEQNAGAIWTNRVELEIDSEVKLDPRVMIWHGYSRFNAGFADWRGVAAAGIAGATQLISQ